MRDKNGPDIRPGQSKWQTDYQTRRLTVEVLLFGINSRTIRLFSLYLPDRKCREEFGEQQGDLLNTVVLPDAKGRAPTNHGRQLAARLRTVQAQGWLFPLVGVRQLHPYAHTRRGDFGNEHPALPDPQLVAPEDELVILVTLAAQG